MIEHLDISPTSSLDHSVNLSVEVSAFIQLVPLLCHQSACVSVCVSPSSQPCSHCTLLVEIEISALQAFTQ